MEGGTVVVENARRNTPRSSLWRCWSSMPLSGSSSRAGPGQWISTPITSPPVVSTAPVIRLVPRPPWLAVDTAGMAAERRNGRLQAAITALLERHRRCLHERYPVLGAAVGHITDLETIVGQRVTGATRREN